MNYYLGPYQWVDESWQPPATTVGSIDLRNLTHMGTPIVQDGVGFFATAGLLDVSYDLLGQGDLREINSSGAIKSAWNSLLGYNPNGDKLVDLLYDHLTMGADPTGADRARPLMPDRGNLNLHLNGRVKATQFRIGHSPESNKVIAVLQEDYREIRGLVLGGRLSPNQHRKVLDFWGEKFGVRNPHLIFIPNDLPKETRLPRNTIISENFDGADNAAIGKQLTWVEPSIDVGQWDNVNNHGHKITGGASGNDRRAVYANSALSGADQECSVTNVVQDAGVSSNGGPSCRRSNSAVTYYFVRLNRKPSGGTLLIQKVVTDTATSIGTNNDVTASIPDDLKLQIIGSSLKSFFNNAQNDSITDTAIVGNLFCGLYGNVPDTDVMEFDNWMAEDIILPPTGAASLLMGLL